MTVKNKRTIYYISRERLELLRSIQRSERPVTLEMAKSLYKKLPDGGVWRTIRGNRVYIKDGKILAGATFLNGSVQELSDIHNHVEKATQSKKYQSEHAKREKRLDRLREECKTLKSVIDEKYALITKNTSEVNDSEDGWKKFQQEVAALAPSEEKLKKLEKDYADLYDTHRTVKGLMYLKILSNVRNFGGSVSLKWVEGTSFETPQIVGMVSSYFPTSWWVSASKYKLKGYVAYDVDPMRKRAGYGPSEDLNQSEIRLVKRDYTVDTKSTAVHEMAHRMEHVHPLIAKLERDFYHYRTEGHKLNHLGQRFRADELTRGTDRDSEEVRYMLKDYAGQSVEGYEILSMGMEHLFFAKHSSLKTEKEALQFILGLLATV